MTKEERFTALVKEYEAVIFKVTTIYMDTPEDQEDLYQEIVYQLWKSFDSFRAEAKISTWMYRIAMNTAIGFFKKSRKVPIPVDMGRWVVNRLDSLDRGTEERIAWLYEQIRALGDIDKGLMLLLLEGKKYHEIAEITGFNPSNVGTRISRIKKKMKESLPKD